MSTKPPIPRAILSFRGAVLAHFKKHGRSFPWRETRDPYAILVSEVMLQQTQVERVVPKYEAFLARFPTVHSLATSRQSEVVRAWQGLGYNRRALALRRAAEHIVARHGGAVPSTETELLVLPGVGTYTARAVLAFAFDRPTICIETNIRAAFIHHFFPRRGSVRDRELEPLIRAALGRQSPRAWYQALMDYGAALKASHPNPSRRSAHYTRQSPFSGSLRRLRGLVLRELSGRETPTTPALLARRLGETTPSLLRALRSLDRDGFVREEKNGRFLLA